MVQRVSHGCWQSPLTSASMTRQAARLSEPRIHGSGIYWLESRPWELGRTALVYKSCLGEARDLLPAPHSVRTRAQEYGGGTYAVSDTAIFCVLDGDQRIYRLDLSSAESGADPELTPLTPAGPYRYADLWFDDRYHRLLCIREDYSTQPGMPRTEIVAVAVDGLPRVSVLVSGADFYSNPRISPEGTHLSWLQWHHPQMPWDGTEVYLAPLNSAGSPAQAVKIAGSARESLFQPQWSPGGDLFFVSDRSNWWNLYRWGGNALHDLLPMAAEFATPQWTFAMSTYGFLDPNSLLCCFTQNGQWHLALCDLPSQTLTQIPCNVSEISALDCAGGAGVFIGASATSTNAVYRFDLATKRVEAITNSKESPLPAEVISHPQPISFTTEDKATAHGFYYPPHNPDYRAPDGELPPLIVMCHGGPTGATESSLNPKIQFWTSRGFAVLDVNYRGSTGYGRHYRERLKNAWGIIDVIDVCSGVAYLRDAGLIDPTRVAIRGSSAGGFTVLAALTFGHGFSAGASLYGIGDLETLAKDTHKFESRYLDSLVGPYPEAREEYHRRSPIYHVDKLQCPVIFFQGLQDKVVPPSQAQAMVAALTQKGIANAYITFAEEGHGFRRAETIQRALEAELYFYCRVFGLEPHPALIPIDICHLHALEANRQQ